jgi:hypothetical protein
VKNEDDGEDEESGRSTKPDHFVRFPMTYLTCPKHGTTYPRGDECPDCSSERLRK